MWQGYLPEHPGTAIARLPAYCYCYCLPAYDFYYHFFHCPYHPLPLHIDPTTTAH